MRITLRDYESSDAPRLVELANNENVSQFLIYTFPYPYTMEDANWWISVGSHDNGTITKAIEYDGAFIGTVGITPQVGWKSHTAEIGYWLGEDFWGRGIATEALKLMTEHAFSEGVRGKLFAPVLAPNRASARVLEKNGYLLEGVLKNEVIKNGQMFDILHYAKLRT
ncbi:GNAT family N-acetyltransferase [Pseudohongiella sp.]|uniref:N-acetyltransferase domain-containing protein n=1 Tax=marine sediment metagenome TaxID=412755 RepID=A0A0F9YFF8_9ZZZZ|nr:GNAT family protein [Pseudohongiella sp.]HDZ08285.1 N-acetyltransferase [Pseudohongiella sp.]HEA62561.1 N-acetyltransferase [Pseudohongiella sp.]